MAVEWTIRIEGKNEFGDVCRREVRTTKSWESLFDGDIGLSIDDGKKIMAALQSAVVSHEAETYSPLAVLPDRDCRLFHGDVETDILFHGCPPFDAWARCRS